MPSDLDYWIESVTFAVLDHTLLVWLKGSEGFRFFQTKKTTSQLSLATRDALLNLVKSPVSTLVCLETVKLTGL